MTKAPYSVRRDGALEDAIEVLRRNVKPLPSISDVIRAAIFEKLERDVKLNGHGGHARKKGVKS